MNLYAVSYDLHKVRNYQPLYDLLNGLAGVRLLESFWLVPTAISADRLRSAMVECMDSDDSCAVIQLEAGANWATQNAMTKGVQWLQTRIAA